MLITHAIYGPHCATSKKNQYQIFARVCGNIREFPRYKETGGPIVYCSKKEFDETCRMEQFAINLATLSQSDGPKGRVVIDGEKMTELFEAIDIKPRADAINKNGDDDSWELIQEEFDNINDANDLLKNHNCNGKKNLHYENGFILSSTSKTRQLLSYNDVKTELFSWNKKSGFDLKNNKVKAGRMIIAYKNTKDTSTARYIVRIIIKNNN